MNYPPEIWLPIPGFIGLYEVSTEGNVRKCHGTMRYSAVLKESLLMKLKALRHGYLGVGLWCPNEQKQYHYNVATLAMKAFSGPRPDKHHVCHGNSIPSDNRFWNLRYDTVSGNFRDKKNVKPTGFGAAVRSDYAKGLRQSEIAKRHGVTPSHISRIVNNIVRKED